jgi:ribosomal protein L40E
MAAKEKRATKVDRAERVEAVPRVVEPAKCGRCGSQELRVVYTTPFRESGIRRVTAECRGCGAVNWWDEKLDG